MENILDSKSKTTPSTPTSKHGQSSPWKKKKKLIKPSHSSPSSPKSSSPKLTPLSSNTTTTTSTSITPPHYNTPPASPGSKLKLFFSKLNSPHKNNNNNNSNSNTTSSTPNEGSTPRSNSSSSTPSPVISSPFGFAHITHVNFDSSNQELTGLPRDWGKTLKRSVNKLVTVRRDSTAQRTLSSNGIVNNDNSSGSNGSPHIKSQPKSASSSALLPTAAIVNNNSNVVQQIPPIKSFEYEISNKLRLSTPDDLALSIVEKTNNNKSTNSGGKIARPKSSTTTTTTTTTTITSSTTTTTSSISNNNNNNTVSLTSSSQLSQSSNTPSKIKSRKSSPTKLTSSSSISTISQSQSQSPSPTPSDSGDNNNNNLERSFSILNNLVSLSKDSKSMDSLVIGAPTLIRRDIHITWNHVSGQFEGVPPEWQPMLQPITSEKQKKKRMELRKRLIREESMKCDKEERTRQTIRDRRERTRLQRIERRRSIYIANNNNNYQSPQLKPQLPPPFKSYSLQNFRLWQISGTELFKTKRVEACFESLCSNDVFLLDCGKIIYVWMGEGSSLQKQVKGASIANKIKYENDYINEPITIEFLMDNEKSLEHTEFFRNLTTTTIPSSIQPLPTTTTTTTTTTNPININNIFTNNLIINEKVVKIGTSDDIILQEEDSEVTWLYRVNDNGKITMIDEKPLVPTSLNSNTCFILDCETDIYVWHGKYSHPLKQKVAVIFAKEFLNIFSQRPTWASLHIVHQGEEQWFFKEHFLYWLEDECLVDNSKRNTSTFRMGSSNRNHSIGGPGAGGIGAGLHGNNQQGGHHNNSSNIPTPIPIDSNFMVSDLFSIPDTYYTKPASLSPSPSTASIMNNGSNAFSITSVNKNSSNSNSNMLLSSSSSTSSLSLSSLNLVDKKQHISLDIWKGQGDQWKKITKDLYGHFESSKCYVCHHVYKINGKFQSRAYFWQGSEASIRWWIVFQFGLYKELAEHMQMLDSNAPPTECLTQNKESHEFLKLFNNIFIHYTPSSSNGDNVSNTNGSMPPSSSSLSISSMSSMNSGISSVYSTSPSNSQTQPPQQPPPQPPLYINHNSSSQYNVSMSNMGNSKQTLYQISLIANTFTRSVQFQEFDVSCLNSRDMFIFHSFAAKTIFVWQGKGCSKELKLISQNIANSILNYYQTTGEIAKNEYDLIIDCQEGQEPPIFWKLFLSLTNTAAQNISSMSLEQKRSFYAHDPYYYSFLDNTTVNEQQQLKIQMPPKFYHLFYNVKIRTYVITKISPFCQGDLCEEDSFILDCFYKVFVWFGPDCSNRKREQTKQLAKQYIEESTIGHTLDFTKLVFIDSGEEDAEFRSYFQGWSYNFTLTNWKNNSQSLIGAGADHRLLNSIVSYSSMSSQVDNITGAESGDEGGGYGYGYGGYADTNSTTTTTTSTSVTPISGSPMSSSPCFGSLGSFTLNSADNPPLEGWELELESTINSIKKKPLFSPKQHGSQITSGFYPSSSPSSSHHKAKKYDTIRQMLDDFDLNNTNSTTTLSTINESSPSPPPSNKNNSGVVPDNLPSISEPINKNDNESDDDGDDESDDDELSIKQHTTTTTPLTINKRNSPQPTTSPNLSPVLKNRLLELAHVNNAKHRKRGASETKKHSPLLKSISNQKERQSAAVTTRANHGGSIDAKSMQILKLNKVDMELDLEVCKIENELSVIVENIKDNSIEEQQLQLQKQLDSERLETERLEKERLEERLEKERLEKERLEKERLEKERLEKKRLEKESEERLEKERLEKVISLKRSNSTVPNSYNKVTPIPTPKPMPIPTSSIVDSPGKRVALKVNVPIKPIEIQKVFVSPLNASVSCSNVPPSPKSIQFSPRPIVNTVIISPRPQQPQNGVLIGSSNTGGSTTSGNSNYIPNFKSNPLVSPRPPLPIGSSSTITNNSNPLVSPRPSYTQQQQPSNNSLTSPRGINYVNASPQNKTTISPQKPNSGISINTSNPTVPLQSSFLPSSTLLSSSANSVQTTTTTNTNRPPPLQRSGSVKERINQVENIVKSLSESSNKIPNKSIQRSDSVVSFKSTINTSSKPLLVGGLSEPIIPKCAPSPKTFIR